LSGVELLTKSGIVLSSAIRLEKAELRSRRFIEQLLRKSAVLTCLERPKMDHSLVGCRLDHVQAAFKQIDP
jgi:hypothetical protein